MTYKEYKSSNKNSFIKSFSSKLFTIVIFSMIVISMCNISSSFRDFAVNVIDYDMDFSFMNKITNKVTNIFTNESILPVSNNIEYEIYKDGYKYYNSGDVLLKSSGIVTYIGTKDDYGNSIIVQQSNGEYVLYGNIKESVKLYDYIESGDAIGTSEKYYYYVVLENNEYQS